MTFLVANFFCFAICFLKNLEILKKKINENYFSEKFRKFFENQEMEKIIKN